MKVLVKALRLCFLMLLVALLPIRGAVAAAMLCPMGASQHQHHDQRHAEYHGEHHHADAHHADHGRHAPAAEHGSTDKCNTCAAFCSLTPLVTEAPTLLAPATFTAAQFAAPDALPPSHLSGGQERPPRTI